MFTVRWLNSLSEIPASQWDALFAADSTFENYPFCRHAFLLALEQGGSVDGTSGWHSQHITVWQGEALIAAMPGYLKQHSYGEYLFDWQIAEAHHQFKRPYYPKWITAIPFTPAFGPRLGVRPELFDTALCLICEALQQQIDNQRFYSAQWLYIGNALQGACRSMAIFRVMMCSFYGITRGIPVLMRFYANLTRASVSRSGRSAPIQQDTA